MVRAFIRRLLGISPGPVATDSPLPVSKEGRLIAMLRDARFKWRSIGALASGINSEAGETRSMLNRIGAVRSRGSNEVYRLPGSGPTTTHVDD